MAYHTISKILQKYDSDINTAQAHGMATAMLCIEQRIEADTWLAELFSEDADLLAADKASLDALFKQTSLLLNPEETEFRFDLLLPTDDDLEQQVIALSDWCQGFLWGIGHTQHSSIQWSKEIEGILRDMVEFTKLDAEIAADSDEDEEAFMQIHQYLRAAVLIVRDELNQHDSESIH